MLLMQEPKLLLLDEPVAGMSDEETERTAELFLSLAGEHSLVVVEHDMDFRRARSRARSRCCTKAACSPKGRWTGAERSSRCISERVIEVYSGALMRCCSNLSTKLNQYYGGSHILRDVSFECPPARCTRCSAATASARRRCCA
jgi:ABC-type glutathione transport system ATPase component